MAGAHQIAAQILAGADQVTKRLLGPARHPDRAELAGEQQPRQVLGVSPIRRARAQAPITGLVLYSSAFLAGLFQTATHVPLLLEAGGSSPWGAVLLHSALAPVITAIALWFTARSLTTAFPEAPGGERATQRRKPE